MCCQLIFTAQMPTPTPLPVWTSLAVACPHGVQGASVHQLQQLRPPATITRPPSRELVCERCTCFDSNAKNTTHTTSCWHCAVSTQAPAKSNHQCWQPNNLGWLQKGRDSLLMCKTLTSLCIGQQLNNWCQHTLHSITHSKGNNSFTPYKPQPDRLQGLTHRWHTQPACRHNSGTSWYLTL